MKVLVTGATGNVGRRVVDHLLARGAGDVRALTNDPARAALPDGVEVVEGWLGRPSTLPAAFDGVDRMYLAPPQERADEVLGLAARAGVRHLVDLSGEHASWWGHVTRAVEGSGIGWTHLWPADFMENHLMWAEQIRRTGAVHEPYPAATSAPIAMDDIAEVAAALLLADPEPGTAHDLRGPEGLTRAEMVHQIGDATGRDVSLVQATPEEAIAQLTPAMGSHARWYVETALATLNEEPMTGNGLVAEITGRQATTFAQWAAAHAAEFS